jgi:hypothetical protein
VHGEIDAAGGERLLDFFGEHALGADFGEGNFLKAVAGGFYNFDFDLVALDAQEIRDVISLPQGELRTATADAEFHRRASVVFRMGFIARFINLSLS